MIEWSSGTFETTKNGKPKICAYYSHGSGNDRKFIRGFGDTEAEAITRREQRLHKLLTAKVADGGEIRRESRLTLTAIKDQWLDSKRPDELGYESRRKYEASYRLWIIPFLDCPIEELTKAKIREHFVVHLPSKTTVSSQRNAFIALNATLNWAAKNDLIVANPMSGLTKPALERTTQFDDTKFINKRTDLAIRMLKKLREEDHPDALLWTISLTLGLRKAELLGLTWDCFSSLERKNSASVVIKQQLKSRKDHGWHLYKYTKNKEQRWIELPESIRIELLRRKNKNVAVHYKDRKELTNLIWWKDGGHIFTGNDYSNSWNEVLSSYTRTYFRPHYNRHIASSLLHRAGYSLDQAAKILGHKDSTITREVYTHLTKEQGRSAMEDAYTILNPDQPS